MVKIGNRVLVNGVWVLDGCQKCMENCNKICEDAVKLAFDDNTFLSCDYFSKDELFHFYKSARPLTFPMKCVKWYEMNENQCYCTNCKIAYFPREKYESNNPNWIGYSEKCPHCDGEPKYMENIIYKQAYEGKNLYGDFSEDIDYTIDEYLNYLDWVEYFDHSFSEEDYPYIPAFHDPLYDKRCWMQPKELCVFLDNCGNSCVYCKSCPEYKDCVRECDDTL